MTTLVNGRFEEQVSAFDRGLLYGQSVFETIAVVQGQTRLREQHLNRLELGMDRLNIPLNINIINDDIDVISNKINPLENAVLRITVTMGRGGRGYQNPAQITALRILSLHEYPTHPEPHYIDGINLGLSDVQLAAQPLLAGIKHGNRLEQILARQSWQPDWQEALLQDGLGNIIEGTSCNVVLLKEDHALTPKLDQCGVDGVMKNYVLELLKDAGFSTQAVRLSVQDIEEADEVILTNSIIGVWPVKCFQNRSFNCSKTAQKLIRLLRQNEIIPSN